MINNVIEGDCMEKMKFIPNKSIDMILCDLPYGKYTKQINTCGSGSFLVAALSEKRRFIGIEKNINVFHFGSNQQVDLIKICKKRLKEIKKSLFPRNKKSK